MSSVEKSTTEKLQSFEKPAWKPIVEDTDGSLTASKFSGTPWLAQPEDWPTCSNCKQPMQLFVQLNLSELPEPLQNHFGTGLIQLFYCTSTEPLCEDDCEAYFPFSASVVVRLVAPESGKNEIVIPDIVNYFPARQIIGWEACAPEWPMWEEAEDGLTEAGVTLSAEEMEFLDDCRPELGDKVGGWPHWIQGVEYPNCPLCDTTMHYVFQIDSDDHLPHRFGDSGCGHITQCPEHKEQLAFGWACF